MNNSQIADLITQECKRKNIKIGEILQACNINHSFLYDIKNKNRAPSVDKLSAIADYLGVSVDCLLGRTETQNGFNNETTQTNQSIQNNNNLDEMTTELIKRFQKLSFDDKLKVFDYIQTILNCQN